MTSFCDRLEGEQFPGFQCAQVEDKYRIRSPLVFPDGHIVEFYAVQQGEVWYLTDVAETSRWLFMKKGGKDLTENQRDIAESICIGHQCNFVQDEIVRPVRRDTNVHLQCFRFAQCLADVAGLSRRFQFRDTAKFKDEVENTFGQWELDYERHIPIELPDEDRIYVDFRIAGQGGVNLVETLSAKSRSSAKQMVKKTIAHWDVIEELPEVSRSGRVSILDDTEEDVWPISLLQALAKHSELTKWSEPKDVQRTVTV